MRTFFKLLVALGLFAISLYLSVGFYEMYNSGTVDTVSITLFSVVAGGCFIASIAIIFDVFRKK